MSERDGYQPGVPCWVDTWQADPDAAAGFYAQLLGWEADETTPPGSPRRYLCAGWAGATSPASARPDARLDDVRLGRERRRHAAQAAEHGGRVVMEPFDMLDGGRGALLADRAGAVFGVWQPGRHRGAQLVNHPGRGR